MVRWKTLALGCFSICWYHLPMNFDRPPYDEVLQTKEVPLEKQELLEGEVVVDERYTKEILPIIKIFKPEGVSLEDYESQFMDELYEDVKKMQTAKGVLMASPDEEINDMQQLLHARFSSAVEKMQRYEVDPYANKAAAAIIVSGNLYDGWNDSGNFANKAYEIGPYIKPVISEYLKAKDFDAVKEILNTIDVLEKKVDSRLYAELTPSFDRGYVAFNEEDQRKLLSGNMPLWIFERYGYLAKSDELFEALVPESYYKLPVIASYFQRLGLNHKTNPFDVNTDKAAYDAFNALKTRTGTVYEEFKKIDPDTLSTLAHQIIQEQKGDYAFLDAQEKRELFKVFQKNDYEDLLKNGASLFDISLNLEVQDLSEESKSLFVEKWRAVFAHKDNYILDALPAVAKALQLFPDSEVAEIIIKRVFNETINLPEPIKDELVQKVAGPHFTEFAEHAILSSDKIVYALSAIQSLSKEAAGKYIAEEVYLLKNKHYIYSPNRRDELFDMHIEHLDTEHDQFTDIKKSKIESIRKALQLSEGNAAIPEQFAEKAKQFEEKYGKKGKSLVSLAVLAYGIENFESFDRKLKAIEMVLDKYNPEYIPSGFHVSMGIEYEVTRSLANEYNKESILGYSADALLVSTAADIKKGNDAVHEFALKPTYNPYMILAEVKLLQDAGLLDFNFEKYPDAARGYHLSLVGDSGLDVDPNMYFLNNVMTMSELTGALAGNEIRSTKAIHSKLFESFSNSTQKGTRCEIKGMACDTVEQFEKAIITAHHAGIAIQLSNKYIPEVTMATAIGASPEEFEQIAQMTGILAVPFETDQERDILFAWMKLKNDILGAIETHNESFIDSEFNGFVLDNEGNYIDTGEHIDIVRNKALVDMELVKTDEFKQQLHISPLDLFSKQYASFVNPLIRTNNIFLKPPQGKENSPVNARAMLDVMKAEGYGDIQDGKPTESIFDRGGTFREGYYVVQGASEEMITHKSQIVLNHFNKTMDALLQQKGIPRTEDNIVIA